MNARLASLTVPLLLSTALIAQGLNTTVYALTGSSLSVSNGPSSQTVVVPPGPVSLTTPFQAWVNSPTTSAFAMLRPHEERELYATYVGVDSLTQVVGGSSAAIEPIDIIAELSYPVMTQVRLELTRGLTLSVGQPMPALRIDLYNDGTYELDEWSPEAQHVVSLIIGPTPVQIRFHVEQAMLGDGACSGKLGLAAFPEQMVIDAAAFGCIPERMWLRQTFDHSLDYGIVDAPGKLYFSVFGLATTPVYLGSRTLPPTGTLAPCLLLPSADAYVVTTSAWGVGGSTFRLDIPLAVRPIDVYAQAVRVDALGIATTNAFRVGAR